MCKLSITFYFGRVSFVFFLYDNVLFRTDYFHVCRRRNSRQFLLATKIFCVERRFVSGYKLFLPVHSHKIFISVLYVTVNVLALLSCHKIGPVRYNYFIIKAILPLQTFATCFDQ